jgi:pyruvate,water dikinase
MRAAGMAVPPGFVVTAAAFEDSLADRGVLEQVRDLTRETGAAVDEIGRIVLRTPLSEPLEEEITSAYAALGPDVFVAVRSSACAEDGESASFAGQQETFLNVRGIDQVLEKVVECWGSFFSERAIFYRQRKGSLADLGMAVVVQEQIGSDKSGVIFTTDPIRGRSDQMVIEAAFGLGEAVVSGLVTPDNYVARRDGRLKKATVGRQDRIVVRDALGGTMTLDLDPDTASTQVLTEAEIARLVEVGLRLEAEFGSPQDVEWAIEGDDLYVLQSRPITA